MEYRKNRFSHNKTKTTAFWILQYALSPSYTALPATLKLHLHEKKFFTNIPLKINFFLWFRRKVTFIDFPVCLAMYMVQVLLQIHYDDKTWHNYIHSLMYIGIRVQERKYS